MALSGQEKSFLLTFIKFKGAIGHHAAAMNWLFSRFRSLEVRFAVALSIVLFTSTALTLAGVSLDRRLIATVETIERITSTLGRFAEADTRLRDLRRQVLALDGRTANRSAAEWATIARSVDVQRRPDANGPVAQTVYGQRAEAEVRAAEQRFVRVTHALLVAGKADPSAFYDGLPQFQNALRSLEYWRDAVRQALRQELKAPIREAEIVSQRTMVETIVAAVMMVALVGGLILWLRWRIVGPLMTIVLAVRGMNGGRALPALPYARRSDELGELTRALQTLAQERETRERAQRQVEYLAHHDSLTGLANRLVFAERMDQALRAGQRIALLAIDLDGFKSVNDTLGHAAGDIMLQRTGTILRTAAGEEDVVARIGGDEFAIIHYLAPDQHDACMVLSRIFDTVAQDRAAPTIRMSIGVALSQCHGSESDELQACADIALYRAKADGRHRARHYDTAMDEDRRQRHWLAHELGEAASRGEMSLVFQPIADCASRRIIGQEALARWTHPVLGPISPDTFIALAEEHGLIADIGQYLLVEALTTARHWPMDWKLAINLSPVQLREPQLGEQMLATILAHGMDPVRVEVEVTEGVLIEQRETATANLRTLRAAGVQIVMDDFGTGYSSLSSLQQFPFDKIKIDRSFISAMDAHGPALSIVRASLGLGRSLNIPIVAEGVETEAQLTTLRSLGCDQVQGYLIGRPGVFRNQVT